MLCTHKLRNLRHLYRRESALGLETVPFAKTWTGTIGMFRTYRARSLPESARRHPAPDLPLRSHAAATLSSTAPILLNRHAERLNGAGSCAEASWPDVKSTWVSLTCAADYVIQGRIEFRDFSR